MFQGISPFEVNGRPREVGTIPANIYDAPEMRQGVAMAWQGRFSLPLSEFEADDHAPRPA